MRKKGISTIIVTIILVALVLVAVGIVWAVISNIISKSSEDVSFEKFTLDAEIKAAKINETENNISLLVKRKAGVGDLEGFKFIFNNGTDAEVATQSTTMKELEEQIFTFNPKMNVSNILTIILVPLIKSGGNEILGLEKVYDVSSLGTITSGGAGEETPCTPTNCSSLGYECGNWSEGCGGQINCGTCGAHANCSSGTCVCDSGWADCDDDNACECNLSSGSCVGGSCVPQQICGNNITEGTEICDGTDLGGETCISQGFDSGNLSCNSSCSGFDTSECTSDTLSQGLLAYYPFNGSADDASGNGYDGTVHGATLISDKDGNPNSAYRFDGYNDYINIEDSFNLGTSNWTITFWINQYSAVNFKAAVAKGTYNGAGDILIYDINNAQGRGYMSFRNNDNTGQDIINIGDSSFSGTGWRHVAVVRAGNVITTYLDGQESNTGIIESNYDFTNSHDWTIGAREDGTSAYIYAGIDEVRIYNRALLYSEIQSLSQ